MRTCPAGWATDLAILEHTGSVLEDHEDHLVVRTPHNPDFYWGNFLLVTDEDGLGDAGRWVSTFQLAFPEATWVAIGLTRMPEDQDPWVAQGLQLELDDVLTTRTLPRQAPLPEGYTVRRLSGRDWARSVARSVAENDRTGEHDPTSYERFAQREAQARRTLSRRGIGAWFGAFSGASLVADLGIVRCGTTARYQDVSTDDQHRRHGLASHLLGVAARWAADGGCDQWVIVTEAANPAGRVYRSLGFAPDTGIVQAYRRPPGSTRATTSDPSTPTPA
ncbi:MAG TPA: GNAT family N-acetyltransferase [Ornithinibacter sp.]|nr:GNAT family N-acetyltransferase [Ornithinibacter sp.]